MKQHSFKATVVSVRKPIGEAIGTFSLMLELKPTKEVADSIALLHRHSGEDSNPLAVYRNGRYAVSVGAVVANDLLASLLLEENEASLIKFKLIGGDVQLHCTSYKVGEEIIDHNTGKPVLNADGSVMKSGDQNGKSGSRIDFIEPLKLLPMSEQEFQEYTLEKKMLSETRTSYDMTVKRKSMAVRGVSTEVDDFYEENGLAEPAAKNTTANPAATNAAVNTEANAEGNTESNTTAAGKGAETVAPEEV